MAGTIRYMLNMLLEAGWNQNITMQTGTGGLIVQSTPSSNGTYTTDMVVTTNGNVGIGTTAPTHTLEVAGNVKFGCPSGMTSYGRGCIGPVQSGTDAYSAETLCMSTYGGSICMYNEILRACAAGAITSYGASQWMGDRQGGDNYFSLTNTGGCGVDLDQAPAVDSAASYGYRCCL